MALDIPNVPQKLEFLINNRNRLATQDALAFDIAVPWDATLDNASYSISVDRISFENVLPVIQTGINDQLWFSWNGGTRSVLTLAEGNYDIYDLIATIKATLITLDAGFDLTFDTRQFRLVLTVPAHGTFILWRTNPNPLGPLQFTLNDPVDRLLEVLGWSFDQNDAFELIADAVPLVWTAPDVVRVRSTGWVDLCANVYLNGSLSSNPALNGCILGHMPLEDNFGQLLHYQFNNPSGFRMDNATGLIFRFYFTDEWGQKRTMGNKNLVVHFQLCLTPLLQN